MPLRLPGNPYTLTLMTTCRSCGTTGPMNCCCMCATSLGIHDSPTLMKGAGQSPVTPPPAVVAITVIPQVRTIQQQTQPGFLCAASKTINTTAGRNTTQSTTQHVSHTPSSLPCLPLACTDKEQSQKQHNAESGGRSLLRGHHSDVTCAHKHEPAPRCCITRHSTMTCTTNCLICPTMPL